MGKPESSDRRKEDERQANRLRVEMLRAFNLSLEELRLLLYGGKSWPRTCYFSRS